MVSVTLSVPEDVRLKMQQHNEINWSGFIRNQIIEKTKELEWKEHMLKKLESEKALTDWSVALQHKARKGRSEELYKQGKL